MNTLVICRIYLKRTVQPLVRENFSSTGPGGAMMNILTARSRDAYFQLLYHIFYGRRFGLILVYKHCS